MLSPLTLTHLAAYTCPRCCEPLGRFHAYPLFCPSQVISLTSALGPHHRHCAEEQLEDMLMQTEGLLGPGLHVVAIVKASPRSPSARLTRLNPADPESATLLLFTPEQVHFHHVALHDKSIMVRPATNEEVFKFMEPAIQDAMTTAKPGTDEHRELLHTLGLIQKRWITPPRTALSESPTEDGS